MPIEKQIYCPYCNQPFDLPIEAESGLAQEFVYDCEICCMPILIKATFDIDGVNAYIEVSRELDD